jgi:hypothetical protein
MDRDALMADTIIGLLGDSAELPGSMIIPGICCPQTFVRTAERFMKQRNLTDLKISKDHSKCPCCKAFEIKLGHSHTTKNVLRQRGEVAAADEVASEQKAVVKDHRAHLDGDIVTVSPTLVATASLRER